MAITVEVLRDYGHPWDKRPGFDLMYLHTNSKTELDTAVASAERKFWQPWLLGTSEDTGKPCGVMYKPSGIKRPWHDLLEHPYKKSLLVSHNEMGNTQ